MQWTCTNTAYLTAGQDLYFHLNHPIKWVQVAGVVVAIDEFYGRRVYTIDDGSGATIECVLSVPKQNADLAAISATAAEGGVHGRDKYGNKAGAAAASAQNATTQEEVKPVVDGEIDVGHVLLVKGNVTVFRKNKQMRVYKILHLRCTDDEVQFWKKMTAFHHSVLSVPWSLSEKELKRCRKEATRSGEGEPSEQRRGKRRAADAGVTGLEKTTVLKAKGVTPAGDGRRLPKVKVTGLEPAAKRGVAVATAFESSSIPKTRPATPALDEARPRKARVTGLESTTMTITSTLDYASSSKQASTGLERKNKTRKADGTQMAGRTSSASPVSDSRAPIKAKITGLERGLKPVIASRRGLTSDSELDVAPPARSARPRATGLEKKPKRVKTLHVEGKYDALGI